MRGGKVWLWVLVLAGTLSVSVAQVEITEVMYDPGQCSDTLCEWVELWNNGSEPIELVSCLFNGKNLSGTLAAQSYIEIVRNKNNFNTTFGPVSNILQLSFSLPNEGGMVRLSGACNDSVDYTTFTSLANGNNKTLERRADGTWGESLVVNGTPGKENSIWKLSGNYGILQITEIMPNPFGADDATKPGGEWVELYNPGADTMDLQGLTLRDTYYNNELIIADNKVFDGTLIRPRDYKLIYRDKDTDFNLNDEYDEVRLFSASGLGIDNVSYSGATSGMSWSKVNEQWFQTAPTPGSENTFSEDCDWWLSFELATNIFTGTDFEYALFIDRDTGLPRNITVRGQIEDAFGNIVKTYEPWTNDFVDTEAHKSYSPNLPTGMYQLHFWVVNLSCPDLDLSDNNISRAVIINPQYKQNQSFVALEVEGSWSWGDEIPILVNIYKGKETKRVVQVWVERGKTKVSPVSKLTLVDQYQNYNFTVPLPLDDNCDGKIADGDATVIVDGLDLRAEQRITVLGRAKDGCVSAPASSSSVSTTTKSSTKKVSVQFALVDLSAEVTPGSALRVRVQIQNDDKPHEYTLFGYLYRGSKCYSCENGETQRDAHKQTVKVKAGEVKIVDLLLKADETMDEGEYKLKVKIQKDQQKTQTELTSSIYVQNKSVAKTATQLLPVGAGKSAVIANVSLSERKILPDVAGITVYEASSERAKKTIPYFLLTAFGLLSLILVWRKK